MACSLIINDLSLTLLDDPGVIYSLCSLISIVLIINDLSLTLLDDPGVIYSLCPLISIVLIINDLSLTLLDDLVSLTAYVLPSLVLINND